MSLRSKVLAGSALVTAGEVVGWSAAFVRNMVLARVLTKEDFGLAATCTMAMSLLELTEKVAISRLVVQNKEGNSPRFIATAHLAQLVASILGAIAVVSFAYPLAKAFGIEAHTTALRFLGLLLFFKGFEHFDVVRMERDLRFMPATISSAAPQVISVLLAWPVAVWLGDFRAVLVLLGAKSLATVILTHVFAERPFALAYDKVIISHILKFSWPLLLNGFLMLAVFQGDQFVVASFYSMADLGEYVAAATLASAPIFIAARVLSSVMLPVMARAQDDLLEFRRRYSFCIQSIAGVGSLYLVGTILAAQGWITLGFGSKYQNAAILLIWLSVSNAFRMVRIAPAIAALAKGDSSNQMISNVLRIVGLVPAVALGVAGAKIWSIAAAGLIGEALALIYSVYRLKRRDAIPGIVTLAPVAVVSVVTVIAVLSRPLFTALPLAAGLAAGTGVAILSSIAVLWALPESGEMCKSYLNSVTSKIRSARVPKTRTDDVA
jgi:O-antigen/teichoic acid export membrane protein